LAVLGVCATIGMLVFSSSSSSSEFGNADAGVKKGFLTFVTVKEMKVRGAYEEIGTIWTADLDGTKRRRLAAGNVPDISPDGRWVAFVNRANQLQVIASEGGASRLMVRKPNPYAFRWAPNSRRLGVVIGGSLVVIDIETGERVTIDRGRHVYGFSFSPSGKEIAWARKTGKLTPTLGGNDIYRASTSGGHVHRLTRNRGSSLPVWGPKVIAFARFEPFTLLHPRFELWFLRPDGRAFRRVSDENLAPFSWSRDGRRLLAYADSEVTAYPYAVDPSSGNGRSLIRHGGAEVSTAAFSRDGRWVLAWNDGKLVQIPWAGGEPRVLVRGVDELADWTR